MFQIMGNIYGALGLIIFVKEYGSYLGMSAANKANALGRQKAPLL